MATYANSYIVDYKNLSALTTQQLPGFVLEDAPLLHDFLEAYFEWLDQQGNANYELRNLRNYRDIDRTLDKFVDWFHDEFMIRVPKDTLVDRRFLMKRIRQMYRAKGSQLAYRFLFKILFNEEIDFYYPGTDILRASDGRWVIEKSIILNSDSATEGETVIGTDSGARGRIEKIVTTIKDGISTQELFLSKIIGTFDTGESILQNGQFLGYLTTFKTYDGYYDGTYGFLSWDKYLQDNYYYQEFSYEIRASQTFDKYREIAKRLLHPSGTILFNRYVSHIDIETLQPRIDSRITIGTRAAYLFERVIYANSSIQLLRFVPPNADVVGLSGTPTLSLFNDFRIENDETITYTPNLSLHRSSTTLPTVSTNANSTLTVTRLPEQKVSTTGTWWTANNPSISSWGPDPLSDYSGWRTTTFYNGTGKIGDNTKFLSELFRPWLAGDMIKVVDNDGIVANTYNFVRSVQTDYTCVLEYAMDMISNGSFIIPEYSLDGYSNTTGTFRTLYSNTGVENIWESSLNDIWKFGLNDLYNNRGVIGNNTIFQTELVEDEIVWAIDSTLTESNSWNKIVSISSNTGCVIYVPFPTTNGYFMAA